MLIPGIFFQDCLFISKRSIFRSFLSVPHPPPPHTQAIPPACYGTEQGWAIIITVMSNLSVACHCQPHFSLDVGPCNTALSIRSTVNFPRIFSHLFFNLSHQGCQSEEKIVHIGTTIQDCHFLYNLIQSLCVCRSTTCMLVTKVRQSRNCFNTCTVTGLFAMFS